ncbi:MAG: UDP-N-acetylmuramoyl-L-alanine--D-glutamate ligase [Terriglobia bacterium]
MMELRNKRVLVVGLARSGRAVARRLAREGALVTVTDLRPPSSFGPVLHEMMDQKIGFELGVHREETFLDQDLIVVSPGVPWDIPPLEAARQRKVLVVPEVEAASWFFDCTLVGVTGTNGKTTTTALLGKILEASGYSAFVAGNIGVPLISAVDLFSPESIVVAELSSFQLEAVQTFRAHLAVLLNITENHLDRHRTFDAYVAAKAQIFRNQRPEDYAILNADDPMVMSLAPVIASTKVFFSMEQDLPQGILLSKGKILYRIGHLERVLMETRDIRLRGFFNVENVMAAAAAACVLGADFKAIRSAVREFNGVEHRLEYVRKVRGVEFYDDSKATSVDAAAKALQTFERGVHLILGGKDKGAPYTPLRPLLEGRVKGIYLIGEASEKIAADLAGADLHRCRNLETAVRQAAAGAIPGDVVLLSPACASFDQFQDFEERGRAFKGIVARLTEVPLVPQVETFRPAEAPAVEPPTLSGPVENEPTLLAADSRTEQREEREALAPEEPAYIYETSEGTAAKGVSEGLDFDEATDLEVSSELRPREATKGPVSPYEVLEEEDAEEQRRQKAGP